MINVSLQELLGKGYGRFFNFKGRYRCIKGSRNSKKSVNMIQIAPIWDIISNPENNVMILRAVDKDNRQSTFANIKKGIRRMKLWNKFKIRETTMDIIYKPTGQIIFFRGSNDPESITSVTCEVGTLNKLYIEEAFQIRDYETFRKIDGSFRGECKNGAYFQITMIFNPWIKDHWLYTEFFHNRLEDDYQTLLNEPKMEYINEDEVLGFGKGIYLMTNNYKINEFRDKETWDVAMEEMRQKAIEYFKVEGLGMWGNSHDRTYIYFNDSLIKPHNELLQNQFIAYTVGIDIGMGNGEGKVVYNTKEQPDRYRSAMTMTLMGLTMDCGRLIVLNEWFYSNEGKEIKKGAVEVAEDMIRTLLKWQEDYRYHRQLMKGVTLCYVDSADPGGFRTLLDSKARELGLFNARFIASTKNRIQSRIDFENLMMAYGDMLFSPQCPNLIREIKNAAADDKGNPRADVDDHVITAAEYAMIPLLPQVKRWKNFKEQ